MFIETVFRSIHYIVFIFLTGRQKYTNNPFSLPTSKTPAGQGLPTPADPVCHPGQGPQPLSTSTAQSSTQVITSSDQFQDYKLFIFFLLYCQVDIIIAFIFWYTFHFVILNPSCSLSTTCAPKVSLVLYPCPLSCMSWF